MRQASPRNIRFLQILSLMAVVVVAGCSSNRDKAGEERAAKGSTGPETPGSAAGNQAPARSSPASDPSGDDLVGTWRAVLASPGGELPFALTIVRRGDGYAGEIGNGDERRSVLVERSGDRVMIQLPPYDAVIEAGVMLDPAGKQAVATGTMGGEWRKTIPGGMSRLAFSARRGDEARFASLEPPGDAARDAVSRIAGKWAVGFKDADGEFAAVAELRGAGDRVQGTFLTATGDYRYLAGTYDRGFLRLSTFDGAHAFLFHARARADGTLVGDFWSRDSYHATWTAEPLGQRAIRDVLPDPYDEVRMVSADGKLGFRFADLDGRLLGSDDPRFRGKVVLVDIFGSWCPNCNDAAPLLAELHRTYRDRGLEVVGLAFEFTGDVERDRRILRAYKKHHGIEFPLLLAGTSDKKDAAAILPDLSAIKSYPTAIFIARDGRVAKIHSGFAGPGTGSHHDELVADYHRTLEELLGAPASPGGD